MELINSEALKELIREELPDSSENWLTKKDAVKLIKRYAMQEYFNAGEACDFLGISRSTLSRLRKLGYIKPRIVEGIERYRKKDLLEVFK